MSNVCVVEEFESVMDACHGCLCFPATQCVPNVCVVEEFESVTDARHGCLCFPATIVCSFKLNVQHNIFTGGFYPSFIFMFHSPTPTPLKMFIKTVFINLT